MSDNTTSDGDDVMSFVEQMNEEILDAYEQNLEAQGEFVEAWMTTLDDSTDDADLSGGLEGYAEAYETWMDAAETQLDLASDALQGEDIDVEEFRDVWLTTANQAFKDVMGTTAFAAATGGAVQDALEFRQQADEAAQETLHELGFATRGDVQEVGDRLVELERRQQSVEEKLDRVLDELED